jgi:predicted ribosome quality control (RQC) complex YloA/Tae2 family protein
MDNFYLNAVVAEIAPIVLGRHVSGIAAYGMNLEVDLVARQVGQDGALVVCLEPAGPGLYHSKHVRRARKQARAASETLATRFLNKLVGAELTGISKEPFDRIVRVEFRFQDQPDVPADRPAAFTLVLMLTGRSANVYLEDDGGSREAMLPDRGAPDSARPAFELAADWKSIADKMTAGDPQAEAYATAISARYFGPGSPFSPTLKSEFLFRCQKGAPGEAFASLLNDLEQRPAPQVYSGLPMEEVGKRPMRVKTELLLSGIELASASGLRRYQFDSFSEAANSYYRLAAQAARFEREHDGLLKKLAAEMKKSRSTLNAVEADLEKFDDPEKFKRYGDLILANLATAKIADGRVKVRDYYDPDTPEIEIEIGDRTSLQKASSAFYLQCQKAQRALKALGPRARSLEDRIRTLEEMLAAVSADPVIDRVREIAAKLELLTGARRPRAPRAEKKKDKQGREVGRWFTTADGYEVVVGRNDRENDLITFRLAGSQDIWLHAADYPGSHVVIRNPRREAVPFQTILEAAEAAAFYSQARKEGKAAVHYTQKKYVSKPPRSKPGLARLSSFKTLLVEPKRR